jgi:two-component system, cell cycle response regulator CpdR
MSGLGARSATLRTRRAEDTVSAILLAEDDEAVRAFVTRALTHRGHEVTAVSDGDAAIEALKAQTYDLMLTDIVMPGLDGLALAETANKINPRMTVLMMTGFADARERADGFRSQQGPVADVITKPFSLQQICNAVDAALTGQRAVG